MKFKNRKTPETNSVDITMLSKLKQQYINAKHRFAKVLQTQSDKLSIRLKKSLLIAFGLVISGISVSFIVHSIAGSAETIFEKQSEQKVTKGGFPMEDPWLTDKEYQHIRHLMFQLDSVNQSKPIIADTSVFKK
jgi:hypothetical protein